MSEPVIPGSVFERNERFEAVLNELLLLVEFTCLDDEDDFEGTVNSLREDLLSLVDSTRELFAGMVIIPEKLARTAFNANEAIAQALAEKARAQEQLRHRTRIVPRSVRESVLARDSNKCRYCGVDVTGVAQLDHWEPRGPSTVENLVTACRGCNIRKSNVRPRQLRKAKGMKLIGGKP